MKVLLLLLLSTLAFGAQTNEVANAKLTNHLGKEFQVHDFKGKHVFLSFIFTRCPSATMCPLTMRLNRQLQVAWKKANSEKPLQLLIVTLDPTNDTPVALKKYGKTHDLDLSTATLATGTEKTLEAFQSSFNVVGFPSGGGINHNLKSVLIGPDLKEIQQFKDNEWKPADVLRAAGLETASPSTP